MTNWKYKTAACLVLVYSSMVVGETIILNNGKRLEGDILKETGRTDEAVQVLREGLNERINASN